MTDSIRQIRRALISVSDKSGLVPFAEALVAAGVEIVSTGGTAAALTAAGLPVRDVSELTGFPEMMDGRVTTVAGGADFDTCIENIDIGGPAMIRASAKNFDGVTVIVDPADYDEVLAEMRGHSGSTTLALRRRLAAKAFARTAAYDAAISGWFADVVGDETPTWRSFGGRLAQPLRYGENPHQKAAFYKSTPARPGAATAQNHQGKELS